jgi:hypothetical protein
MVNARRIQQCILFFLSVGYIVHKIIHTVSIYYKLRKYFFDILFIFCKKKCNFEAYFYCLVTNTNTKIQKTDNSQ